MTTTIGDERPQTLPTAALAYKRVTFVNKMDNTDGLMQGSVPVVLFNNMATWRPTLEGGWYYLGQGACNYNSALGHVPTAPSGVIVHALEDGALRDVTSWECVWTSEGSTTSRDYALWRGVPPNSDYAVLGGILSTSANFAAPDSAQTYGIKAIRRDLLSICPTYKLWDESYSGARNKASVWVTRGTTGIGTGAMIPMPSHNQPPEDMGLTLDPTKVLEIMSSGTAKGDATGTSESADT